MSNDFGPGGLLADVETPISWTNRTIETAGKWNPHEWLYGDSAKPLVRPIL